MKIYLRKMPGGMLVADDDDAAAWLQGVKNGDAIAAEVTKPRNYKFHRKYMALIRLGFDAWNPAPRTHGKANLPVQKEFHRFRKDVAIASGFYTLTVALNGTTRAEAKSISFAHMGEEEFNALFQQTITLFLEKYQILSGYKDAAEVDHTINEILRFA